MPDVGILCAGCGSDIPAGEAFALIDQHIAVQRDDGLVVRPGQNHVVAALCLPCSHINLGRLVARIPKLLRKYSIF